MFYSFRLCTFLFTLLYIYIYITLYLYLHYFIVTFIFMFTFIKFIFSHLFFRSRVGCPFFLHSQFRIRELGPSRFQNFHGFFSKWSTFHGYHGKRNFRFYITNFRINYTESVGSRSVTFE